ncbi:hypothetical protein L0Y46_04560, partial [bacterium]|nr:hypothetical protein [bacterium]
MRIAFGFITTALAKNDPHRQVAFCSLAVRACSKTLDYCEFMLRAANGGSERLKISTIFFA